MGRISVVYAAHSLVAEAEEPRASLVGSGDGAEDGAGQHADEGGSEQIASMIGGIATVSERSAVGVEQDDRTVRVYGDAGHMQTGRWSGAPHGQW